MIYVGIDVASRKHDCFIMNHNGEVPCDVFTIKNDLTGYKKLLKVISDFKELTNDSKVCIGLESTGHYSMNILNFLTSENFAVYMFNPLLTSMAQKASSVRKTKTDKTDAIAICKFLSGNWNDFKPYTRKLYQNDMLKSLTKHRQVLVESLGKAKIELTNVIDRCFPEYKDVFSSLYVKCSLEFLKTFHIPKIIRGTRVDALANNLYKTSRGHHGTETARKIKELAKNTIGDDSDYYAFDIKMIINKIQFLELQIDGYNEQIKVIMDEFFSNILSMPGVGYTTGAIIVAGIGDISRFDSADKLVAFIGQDPTIYESGNYTSNNSRMSKRGSKHMRFAIHHISNRIIHADPKFSSYYQKKKSEGKHHLVALGHVGKKVIKVIYSLLKYDNEYVSTY